MTAPVAAATWRKSSRSNSGTHVYCVEVAVAVTCVRRFCNEAATTVRADVEVCGFCAAERDMIAVVAAGCR